MKIGKRRKNSLNRNNLMVSMVYLVPALLIYTMIVYYPLVRSFFYSVTDFDGMKNTYEYVGASNFINMFTDKLVIKGFSNTFKFAFFTTIFVNGIALLLAVAFDSRIRFRNYFRAVFYIPSLLSPVIISAVFVNIMQYEGLLNTLFNTLGMEFLVVDWFGSKSAVLPLLMVLNVWQWCGYGAIIYLAGLQSIPTNLYEAADIDGAGRVVTFFRVTLPLLMPSITIMTFMNITGGLKLFDMPYVLTRGGPNHASETLGTVIYTLAFAHQKMGYATAISIVFFVIIAFLSILQLKITRDREVEM